MSVEPESAPMPSSPRATALSRLSAFTPYPSDPPGLRIRSGGITSLLSPVERLQDELRAGPVGRRAEVEDRQPLRPLAAHSFPELDGGRSVDRRRIRPQDHPVGAPRLRSGDEAAQHVQADPVGVALQRIHPPTPARRYVEQPVTRLHAQAVELGRQLERGPILPEENLLRPLCRVAAPDPPGPGQVPV